MEETTKKKRRKKYKIETYDEIQKVLEDLVNDCLIKQEIDPNRIRLANQLLQTRLASLKQHELQIEVDKMNAKLEEWEEQRKGGY